MGMHSLSYTIPETESKYVNGEYNYQSTYQRQSTKPESVEVKLRVDHRSRDSYSDGYWRLKDDIVKANDIQCILGIRKIRVGTRNYYDSGLPQHATLQIPYMVTEQSGIPYRLLQTLPEIAGECLSIVYISRKDGRICNDIFHTWCAETGLPFPDQLIHTALVNDVALSEQKLSAGTKSYYYNGYLSMFDCFRNKKIFGWFLRFKDWGKKNVFRVVKSAYKTTYKKPKQLHTWKRRRERR